MWEGFCMVYNDWHVLSYCQCQNIWCFIPISAQTYLHCFTDHSANAHSLPLRQGGNLPSFQNIHVPILGIIGDQDESEYTVIPIKEAVELLKAENSRAEVYQVEKSNHVFSGKEAEVIAIIADFMQRKILV